MTYKILFYFGVFWFLSLALGKQVQLPEGFVYVKSIIPDIEVDLRYYGTKNFIGDTVTGYRSNNLILTVKATNQLKLVQEELQKKNLCLLVYDGYRPQRAVNHFVRWAKDLNDTINKNQFYPNVEKRFLFKEEYIASRSGHSRGSTVDLTIIDGQTGEVLDMGSPYDYFGKSSWVSNDNLTQEQKANRKLLQDVMLRYNFRNYPKEWWHFTLRAEPYPDTYYDFVVE